MEPFELARPTTLEQAQAQVGDDPVRRVFRAGGLDLLDQMKEGVSAPDRLVDLSRATDEHALRMRAIEPGADGLRIGALVTLARLADAEELEGPSAALRDAAGQAATPNVRNGATVGGNLLQRPRCWYFRHGELLCLKKGGDICLAIGGDNRFHAILGGGPSYIVHPSSLGAALLVLEATMAIRRPDGTVRTGPIADLFALPTVDPRREHTLGDAEVLLEVGLPPAAAGTRSAYAAAREKQSHDWPLAEAAVRLRIDGGKLRDVRVALGHVAPIPWRSTPAESVLEGQTPDADLFARAAAAALAPARPLSGNRYKVALARGLLRQVLHRATGVPLPE
jgi:xanthine dehydrogenase YagS FAD-binding subunit